LIYLAVYLSCCLFIDLDVFSFVIYAVWFTLSTEGSQEDGEKAASIFEKAVNLTLLDGSKGHISLCEIYDDLPENFHELLSMII
jgi:hypothetical protein